MLTCQMSGMHDRVCSLVRVYIIYNKCDQGNKLAS
jgi:hypothetical protein